MSATTELLTGDELINRGWEQRENADLFDGRLKYLVGNIRESNHVVVSLGERIIGVGSIQQNPYNDSVLWVTGVSVEEAHQNRGYGRMICKAIFDYAIEHKKKIHPSRFSVLGAQHLQPLFRLGANEQRQAFCDCYECCEQL